MNEPAPFAPPKSPTTADVKIFFTLVSVFAMAAIGFGAWLAGRVSSERADSAPVTEERRLVEGSFYRRPDGAPRAALCAATDRIWLVDATGRVRQRFNGLKATAPDAVLAALDQMRAHASAR